MALSWDEIKKRIGANRNELLEKFANLLREEPIRTKLITEKAVSNTKMLSLKDIPDRFDRAGAFLTTIENGSEEMFDGLVKVVQQIDRKDILQLLVPGYGRSEGDKLDHGGERSQAGVTPPSGATGSASSREQCSIMQLLASAGESWFAPYCGKLQSQAKHIKWTPKVAIVDIAINDKEVKIEQMIDCVGALPDRYVEDPHGTISACIIKHYAPHTRIDGYNVAKYDSATSEWNLCDGAIIKALKAIKIDDDIDIVNMSFGAPDSIPGMDDAVKQLSKNKVLIAAASNDGWYKPDTIRYPARMKEVIAVGSCTEGGKLADHSPQGPELDFLMPGVNINVKKWAGAAGTSHAAPHLVAAASLILQVIEATPELGGVRRKELTTTAHMKAILVKACDGNDPPFSNQRGYGIPQFDKIDAEFLREYANCMHQSTPGGCTILQA